MLYKDEISFYSILTFYPDGNVEKEEKYNALGKIFLSQKQTFTKSGSKITLKEYNENRKVEFAEEYQYDQHRNITKHWKLIDENGYPNQILYKSKKYYSANGNLLKSINYHADSDYWSTTFHRYDELGYRFELESNVEGVSRKTRFWYNKNGQLVMIRYWYPPDPEPESTPSNREISFPFPWENSNKQKKTPYKNPPILEPCYKPMIEDFLLFTYHENGMLAQEKYLCHDGIFYLTKYKYLLKQMIEKEITYYDSSGKPIDISDYTPFKHLSKYDMYGNLIESERYNADGVLQHSYVVKMKYDRYGNITEERNYNNNIMYQTKLNKITYRK